MNLLQTLSHCVCAVFWHINRTFTSTFVARNLSVVRTPNLNIETCYGIMFLTGNSATADGPRDAPCSQNIVKCRNKLYDGQIHHKSNGVRGLQLIDLQ